MGPRNNYCTLYAEDTASSKCLWLSGTWKITVGRTCTYYVLTFIFHYFQVLNIIILILYRTGFNGEFLGVGGTWNLNEEKNPDAEIVASGVIVGYLIYTLVQVVTYLFGTTQHKRWDVRLIAVCNKILQGIKENEAIFIITK